MFMSQALCVIIELRYKTKMEYKRLTVDRVNKYQQEIFKDLAWMQIETGYPLIDLYKNIRGTLDQCDYMSSKYLTCIIDKEDFCRDLIETELSLHFYKQRCDK